MFVILTLIAYTVCKESWPSQLYVRIRACVQIRAGMLMLHRFYMAQRLCLNFLRVKNQANPSPTN